MSIRNIISLLNLSKIKYYFIGNVGTQYATAINDVIVDASDNMYVTGFKATGTAGTTKEIFVSKVDSFYNTIWQKTISHASLEDEGLKIKFDSQGNVYVLSFIFISTNKDVYLIKYDNAGNLVWQKRYSDSGTTTLPTGLTIDSLDNIYITVKNPNSLLQIDTSGNLVNQYTINFLNPECITTDKSNNIYIGGGGAGSPARGAGILKLDSSKNVVLRRDLRYPTYSSGDHSVYGISVDSSENILATLRSQSASTLFGISTVKYNSAGTVQWQACFESNNAGFETPNDISIDASGNVYVIGTIDTASKTLILKYNSSGAGQFYNVIDTVSSDSGLAIVNDSLGDIIATGTIYYSPTATQDGLICKLPADGTKTATYTLSSTSVVYSAASNYVVNRYSMTSANNTTMALVTSTAFTDTAISLTSSNSSIATAKVIL
jgi:hypothetical protein